MNIAIITRPDFRSPRVLASSLKVQFEEQGVSVEIFDEINMLNRLVSLEDSKLNWHFWLKRKWMNYLKDKKLQKKLKNFDALIISECAPNGFLRKLYNIEKLKKIIQKPIGFYEVYYLGNTPLQIEFLKKNNDCSIERYDFHLSVADVTEIKLPLSQYYFHIGIRADSWYLKPLPKKEIIAILDFVYPGNEQIRIKQIEVLTSAGIKFISLEKPYTFEEIRNIYQEAAIYFMQSFESFGLPILECLCCGCQIFTPESWWPMSWRLNEDPEVHGKGELPECFTVYNNEDELLNKLLEFKSNYDCTKTPEIVFNNFLENYPNFYYGNKIELLRLVNFINKIDVC